jgi:phosphoenolpyruvate synthase/pyruvate phosphate dikinase
MEDLVRRVGATSSPAALEVVGGKAYGLARVASAGAAIPPTVVVTVDAQREYIAAAGLLDRHARLCSRLGGDQETRRELAGLAYHSPFPKRLSEELKTSLLHMSDDLAGPWAVRSSAVGEDGGQTSFAGVHTTVLGASHDQVEESIRACWASMWSDSAVTYRRLRDVGPVAEMAVVVQPVVPAVASAVVFGRDPTGAQRPVITAVLAWGLGDVLCDGAIVPTSVTYDSESHALVDVEIGWQDRRSGIQRGVRVDSRRRTRGPEPSDVDAAELVRICCAAEDALEEPLDIEAAWTGESWLLLQARTITTGTAPPEAAIPARSLA